METLESQKLSSDYEKMVGSTEWQGQIDLFFDMNGEQIWFGGNAVYILKWKWSGNKLGYFP